MGKWLQLFRSGFFYFFYGKSLRLIVICVALHNGSTDAFDSITIPGPFCTFCQDQLISTFNVSAQPIWSFVKRANAWSME